jgi:archaellum component FlaC
MLTQEDIQKIGVEMGNLIEQNIMPALDQINGHLDKVDGRFDKIDNRLDRMDGRLGVVEDHLVRLEDRFGAIEKDIAEMKVALENLSKRDKEDSDAFGHELIGMKARMASLEAEVARLKALVAQK